MAVREYFATPKKSLPSVKMIRNRKILMKFLINAFFSRKSLAYLPEV